MPSRQIDNTKKDGPSPDIAPSIVRRIIFFMTVVGISLLGAFLIGGIILQTLRSDAVYLSIIIKHYPATIGLPISGFTAFVLVFVLEYSKGPIEFEGLKFKFKGAAGPLAFWIACFLAINLSIFTLWTREFHSPVAEKVLEDLVSSQVEKMQRERVIQDCISEAKLGGQSNDESEIRKVCVESLKTIEKIK